MKRRIDDIEHWHCGAHLCRGHEPVVEEPRAWRYSVVWGDTALSLVVSRSAGQLALHRAFRLPDDEPQGGMGVLHGERDLEPCDLLKGSRCVVDVCVPMDARARRDRETTVSEGPDDAIVWWMAHAKGGQREQPESFWRALETLGRKWSREVRRQKYSRILCPRCGAEAFLRR